jgi:hypothetical protein
MPSVTLTPTQRFFLQLLGRSELDDAERAKILATIDNILQREEETDVNVAFLTALARYADGA